MHYLVELKIEITASDDDAARKAKSRIVVAAIDKAIKVSGVTTCTMHTLTSADGRVVDKFNHPMEKAMFQ